MRSKITEPQKLKYNPNLCELMCPYVVKKRLNRKRRKEITRTFVNLCALMWSKKKGAHRTPLSKIDFTFLFQVKRL